MRGRRYGRAAAVRYDGRWRMDGMPKSGKIRAAVAGPLKCSSSDCCVFSAGVLWSCVLTDEAGDAGDATVEATRKQIGGWCCVPLLAASVPCGLAGPGLSGSGSLMGGPGLDW